MKPQWQIILIFCFSIGFICAKLDAQEEYILYKGIATDLKSNKFYYVEEHKEVREKNILKQTVIAYKDEQGTLIAGKTIDYSSNKITPSFEQNDYRDGYVEGASFSQNKLVFKYRKKKSEKLKTKSIDIPNNLVIDGGFNYYIKANWEVLTGGKILVFNFAVPSQLDYFSFRLFKEFEQKDVIAFRMEPSDLLLRKFVNPIRVTYNKTNKRILKYEGLSNINDAGGKSYLVKIMYPEVGP